LFFARWFIADMWERIEPVHTRRVEPQRHRNPEERRSAVPRGANAEA
jgi:hypothetical protein